MDEISKKKEFKAECDLILKKYAITDLRCYGRFIGLRNPTAIKKQELIDEITSVIVGEKPCQRNKRGAPIKSRFFQQEIIADIENLKEKHFAEGKEENKKREPITVMNFSIVFDELNEKQKRFLKRFLGSL